MYSILCDYVTFLQHCNNKLHVHVYIYTCTCTCTYMYNVCYSYRIHMWSITDILLSVQDCTCIICIYTCTYMYNVCYSYRIHMWSITDILLSVHVYTHVRTCITYVIVVEYTCGLLLIYF